VRHRTQPPSVWIQLRLEAAPRLLIDATTEAEFNRLCDWVASQEDLAELFARAVESRKERLGRTLEGDE
jgi:hypothetical protein